MSLSQPPPNVWGQARVGRKCQRWTWRGEPGSRVWSCLQRRHIVSWADRGWWVGSEQVREKDESASVLVLIISTEKECFTKHHEDKYAALLGEYSFWGWYLTLIRRILFHFLAVSVYDEGAVCNITLSLYHYQAGSLNTHTQPPGEINTKHKRAIGSYSECKSTFSVPSCLIQLAKIFSMKSFPFVA